MKKGKSFSLREAFSVPYEKQVIYFVLLLLVFFGFTEVMAISFIRKMDYKWMLSKESEFMVLQGEAIKMLDEIKAKNILKDFRGMKAHQRSLVATLMAVQKLAPLVKEIDINPLLTSEEGSFAVDARILLSS